MWRAVRPVSAAWRSRSSAPAINARACSADSRAATTDGGSMRSSALPRFARALARTRWFFRAFASKRIAQEGDCVVKGFQRRAQTPGRSLRLQSDAAIHPRQRQPFAKQWIAFEFQRPKQTHRLVVGPHRFRNIFPGAKPGQRIAAIHPSRGQDVTTPRVLAQWQRAPQLDRRPNQRRESVRLAVVFSLRSAMPRFIHTLARALRSSASSGAA